MPVILELDPSGLWSRQRFDFCNALEDFCDMSDDEKARAELERLGVRVLDLSDPNAVHINMLRGGIARPSVKQIIHIYQDELRAAIHAEEDAAGEPRSTIERFSTKGDNPEKA